MLVSICALTLSSCGFGGGRSSLPKTYTVIWENYNGEILEKDTGVKEGSMPEYNGGEPTRMSDEQYSYKFNDWSPTIAKVYKDITYIAQYNSILEKAKIVFDLDGGVTEHSTAPIYKSTISANDFFFDVTKQGYNFRGWAYKGKTVFDQNGNKKYSPELEETMNFKALYDQNVNVAVIKNIEEAGTITGDGIYDFYSTVELYAEPNDGYYFEGWYYSEILISSNQRLRYTVEDSDVELTAKFSLNSYQLIVFSTHPSLGSVGIESPRSSGGSAIVKYKTEVVVSAQPATSVYDFLGWYTADDVLLSKNFVYSFVMPSHDLELYAKWDAPSYRVTVNKNYENAGTITGEGMHEYSTKVTIGQTTNDGYAFDGWYYKGEKVGQLEIYRFTMPKENVNYEAIWNLVIYNITYILNGGTNSSYNPTTYNVESDIDLEFPTKTGYTFDGWTLEGKTITQIGNGMIGDITLVANWSPVEYSITLDANGGELDNITFNATYDASYTLPTPARPGYAFDGWKNNGSFISQTGTWKYTNVTVLIAQWTIIDYTISYTLYGGTNSKSNPSEYTVEDNIVLADPTKTGYTFDGWYVGENVVAEITKGSTGNINLEARWSSVLNDLQVISEDSTKGSVSIVSGSGYSDENITISATPFEGFGFDGWYHNETKVSEESTYSFKMPCDDYTLVAHFFDKSIRYATKPILLDDEKTIRYGLYPQSNVSNTSLISALNSLTTPESNGWYLYKNDYYAKVVATPASGDHNFKRFDNGTTIANGHQYWFKCEPVIWNVLNAENGYYYIRSSVILDQLCYHSSIDSREIDNQIIYANNYKYSDLRSWLNNTFYNSTFALGNEYIKTTAVDNSAESTSDPNNVYACDNTNDNVFLPSYNDYTNSSYGFSSTGNSNSDRRCKPTDWARAKGTSCSVYQECLYDGNYWTRTPGNENKSLSVFYGGFISNLAPDVTTGNGVRPAITIILNN